MLVDTSQRDMSCTLKLGKYEWKFDAPLGFAPIGISKSALSRLASGVL